MKKSIIWLLTAVMSITFGALLYFQISYLENMVRMRDGQFSESVMRSLYATSGYLERQETLHYLEEDARAISDNSFNEDRIDSEFPLSADGTATLQASASGNETTQTLQFPSPLQNVGSRYRNLQEVLRTQYLYQRGLLDEIILTILHDSGKRPVIERADSVIIRQYLTSELARNGVQLPFRFAVRGNRGNLVYATEGFSEIPPKDVYTATLFPNTDSPYELAVGFPTKSTYIFSSVRFIIPTLALTVILLVVFLYTIILAFRQKKITEMRTDFINNMTHELKTPISTISLSAQMLEDDSVKKSPATLKHLAGIISEESKRLRFQVEKVLQMSVLDKSSGSALTFKVVDANKIIDNVVNTFKIKVERYGGSLTFTPGAVRAEVEVDEMQFTNVVFNLLDNAVKYRREDVEPELIIRTADRQGDKLVITVRDNGIGLRRDDLKRIFEKFYRVSTGNRHDVKGFGLGLAYVRKMVTIFGGSINVESEFGKWTEFTITLPLAENTGSEPGRPRLA